MLKLQLWLRLRLRLRLMYGHELRVKNMVHMLILLGAGRILA